MRLENLFQDFTDVRHDMSDLYRDENISKYVDYPDAFQPPEPILQRRWQDKHTR
jgi:hypothetical protein